MLVLGLGFNLNFYDLVMKLHLGTTYFGYRFIWDHFMVLDIDNFVLSNSNDSYYSLMTTSGNTCDNVVIWHAKFGHIGQERMNRLARENLLGQFTKMDMSTCEYYLVGKTIKKPFRKGTKAKTPLQLIHFDIYGPISVGARHGTWYFITFIDDFTRYGHVYRISHKSKALDCFIRCINLVENQLDKRLKTLKNIYQSNLRIYVMKRVLVDNCLF